MGNPGMPNGMTPQAMDYMRQRMSNMFQHFMPGMQQQQQQQQQFMPGMEQPQRPQRTRPAPNNNTFPGSQPNNQMAKVVLDEKYFRRVDKFDGDLSKFRGWLFDLLVAIGQIDRDLAVELKTMLKRDLDDKWDPELDADVDLQIFENTRQSCMDCCAL